MFCSRPHPAAKHKQSWTRIKISKKPADPGWRRMSPAPKRGEWGAGDVGAPTGAVHYRYFIRDRLYRILKTFREIREPPEAVQID